MNSINKPSPISRFWLLLKPDQSEIWNVYIYSIFSGLVNLSLPIGIQAIINLIQGGQVNTSWIVLLVLVISGVAITGILQISQLRITENLQQKIFTRAAFEFAYRIPKINLKAIRNQYVPELTNRFFDVVNVQKGLSKMIIDFSAAGIQVFFGLVLLSLYHPFFILFSLILVVLVYLIFRLTAKQGLTSSLNESKYKYMTAHWLQELSRVNVTFKLASNSNLNLDNTNRASENYINARESHFKILMKQYGLLVIFKVVITAGLLTIGGLLVMRQQMNIGQFVAAELIFLLVLSSVEKLILSLETVYDVLTSLDKIGQVTDLELDEESKSGIVLKNLDAIKLEINNLSFSYPNQSNPIINDFSLTLAPRTKALISGDNGSGKSTLISLIAGLHSDYQGEIIFQDLPLQNIDRNSLHQHIGYLLSTDALFEGTILQNISVGRDVSLESIQWACEKIGLTDFIKAQSEGYNTLIQPQGLQFPTGIKDKLLLARAIVTKPAMLLVEDTFTNLNATERKQIAEFLYDTDQPWTLVLASTDELFTKYANQIIVLKKNK